MLADPESIILFGDKMKIDGGGNPFSCLFLEPCLGPVPLTERQIKTSCLPTLTLSHHRIFRGSLPLNAWFQQSHRAKGQGKLNLWPSSLTKQLYTHSWERKKSSRHLGGKTTTTLTLENLSNCFLILKYNYWNYIEQFLLSSIPEVPSFKRNYYHTSTEEGHTAQEALCPLLPPPSQFKDKQRSLFNYCANQQGTLYVREGTAYDLGSPTLFARN